MRWFTFNCRRHLPVRLKIELSVDEIQEALKRYVADKITIAEYRPGDVQFVYDGQEDPDEYIAQTIDGAFVTLERSNLKLLTPVEEPMAPEGWRSV
jgi:hypothetical protein